MNTSVVLFHQDALDKFPYLHYIYNAIIDAYLPKGAFKKLDFQEVSFQKIAAEAGPLALLGIELPKGSSIKKSLWEKINYPALVKQLQPDNIFYIGGQLPLLKDAKGARQWRFVADLGAVLLPRDARPAQIKKQQKIIAELQLADKIISYSPAATRALEAQLPASTAKLAAWLPLPQKQYLDPALYTEALLDSFKLEQTRDESYFLIDARAATEDEVIENLKAFSHFKKWQRSSMQLALLIPASMHQNADFLDKFDAYFYKDDVHLLSALDTKSLYAWIRSAYAVVSPYLADQGLDIQLATASLGSLIIAPVTSSTELLLPEARFDLPATDKESLGQVLISSYKSEILRARHIRAGLESAEKWATLLSPLAGVMQLPE